MKQFCPRCNKWIDSNTRKCPECGMIMYAESEYTQTAQRDNISVATDKSRTDSNLDHSNLNYNAKPFDEKSPENQSPKKDDQISTFKSSNGVFTSSAISDLKIDVGILDVAECSRDENRKYTEMITNGQSIPDNLIKREYDDGTLSFLRTITRVPPDEEEKYILMKIFKDLHFIRMLIQTLLILSIIAAVLVPFILAVFN